ncbi:hypothetical protein MTBBW1_2210002 [Desulfamplus magnetovallimortis]|uniref:Amine oxidase domain-containing protein n=1 Tax=Desulfamplus magnetovallimortis TaxID=1246637 RepID=A0A1W1HDE5_9BACT|nr:NAD(P)-binding protein [Desulfamplus magnetovallimortis]SLM30398.1 hypothetical protein MTBBW1_2210002 [Desulfamplus magnetovallimortis]
MIEDMGYDVIVGGGLCGLTTGFLLAKNRRNCLLLEKGDDVGGLARSFVFDDIIFDVGPHVLYENDSDRGTLFLKKMLGDSEVIKRPFRYAIISGDKIYKVPFMLEPLFYPWRFKAEIFGMFFKLITSGAPEASVCQAIESRFGKSFYKSVFEPFIKKKTGYSGEKLHMDWLARPGRDINNIKKIPNRKGRADLLKQLKNFFTSRDYEYPIKGYGEYARHIHHAYQYAGGKTILNCGHISLNCSDSVLDSISVSGKKYPVKNLVWTASVNELNSLLNAKSIIAPYIKSFYVFLTYNGKRNGQREFLYTYHPQKETLFARIYYPDNIYGDYSPRHKEGICLEINHYPEIENMTEQEIIDACVRDVEKLGLFKSSKFRHSSIISIKESMPVYGLDYEVIMEKIFAAQKKYSNIYSIGRTGRFCFCMSPAAVEQGIEMAEHILVKKNIF